MKTRILLFLGMFFAGTLTVFAQSELDAVIKEMETNGYEAIKDKKLNMRNIHFVIGTSKFTPEDKLYLDSISVFLAKVPTIIMEIGGHTDSTGSAKRNEKLSQERAKKVREYVISRGVLPRRMTYAGYGQRVPIADNKTEPGRALNRRVELKFMGLTEDIYTIKTKDGKEVRANYLVISADGKTVSYRENANAPLTRMSMAGIDYIAYPDGSRRRPDAIMLVGGTGGANVTNTGSNDLATVPDSSFGRYGVEPTRGVGKWLSGKFPKIHRWSVIFNAGITPLNVKNTAIDFRYIDSSPSKDNLQTLINLKNGHIGGVGQIGFEWETDKGWLTHVQFQFGRSSQAGLSGFVYGLGKSFGKNRQFIGSLDVTLGNAYLKMGELVQNATYIIVNSTRFDSKTVPIKYRNYFAAFTPQISYNFFLKNNLTLRVAAGYSYSFQTNSVLQFRGENQEGKKVKAKEKLSDPNVTFLVNGKDVTESKDADLFGVQGPYATAGLLYHIYYRTK